ncbi:MAG: hypothetical protein ETSY1_22785 [Candidatus Entotheonella factor]|uniref:Uncharacterized protein n=1 Tax=Entotheonella factor TaxID=1429438 RepID=W4LHD6_ENTF1|nr:MAG: hypothetical protein ETSY1_22785 [Candidatus Entotheonella factor]
MFADIFPVEADAGLLGVLILATVWDRAVRARANFSAVGAEMVGILAPHCGRP